MKSDAIIDNMLDELQFLDLPVLFNEDFAETQRLLSMQFDDLKRELEIPSKNKWHNTKTRIQCDECGNLIGYFHRAKEPEDMIRGARLDGLPLIPEILFCPSCSDKLGDEWEIEPYDGDSEQ